MPTGGGIEALQWSRRVNTAEWVTRVSRFAELRFELQWSRRVNTAEWFADSASSVPMCALQWSRRVNTAE